MKLKYIVIIIIIIITLLLNLKWNIFRKQNNIFYFFIRIQIENTKLFHTKIFNSTCLFLLFYFLFNFWRTYKAFNFKIETLIDDD